MNRRRFSQYLVGLSFLPLAACDYKNNDIIADNKEVNKILKANKFYGVDILMMLKPNLSDNQLGVSQLKEDYPELFKAKNENDLITKANELIQDDFANKNIVLFKKHIFSRLEVIIYHLSTI